MAIVGWPDDVPAQVNLPCAICGQIRSASEMSAGMYDAKGGQAFACNRHFLDMGKLILGWADFATAQHYTIGLDKTNRNDMYEFPLY